MINPPSAAVCYLNRRAIRRKARHRLEVAELLVVAHIQTAGVAHRLKIPGCRAAGTQGAGDQMPPALTVEDRRVQGGKIPALPHLGAKLAHPCLVRRRWREVHELL